jgi:LysR family positive regulator for ilvC
LRKLIYIELFIAKYAFMDFKQLEIFVMLSRELHFAHTAKQCHMTPSALTRSIQRLEEELGFTLLIRNNRRVELTLAGQSFANFAEDVLSQWRRVQESLRSQSEILSGQLRIYSSVTASYSVLSVLLSEFRKYYPQVEIQLHTGDQADAIDRVQQGIDDVAVAALPESLPPTILFKTLTFSPLRFIMPADSGVIAEQIEQLRMKKSNVLNVATLPFIVSEQGLARDRLNAWLKTQRITPNIYAQVSGHEAIVSMVALGFGIGVVPEIVIQHSSMRDRIKVIEDAPVLQAFQIGLCALKSRLEHQAVKAFWDKSNPILF